MPCCGVMPNTMEFKIQARRLKLPLCLYHKLKNGAESTYFYKTQLSWITIRAIIPPPDVSSMDIEQQECIRQSMHINRKRKLDVDEHSTEIINDQCEVQFVRAFPQVSKKQRMSLSHMLKSTSNHGSHDDSVDLERTSFSSTISRKRKFSYDGPVVIPKCKKKCQLITYASLDSMSSPISNYTLRVKIGVPTLMIKEQIHGGGPPVWYKTKKDHGFKRKAISDPEGDVSDMSTMDINDLRVHYWLHLFINTGQVELPFWNKRYRVWQMQVSVDSLTSALQVMGQVAARNQPSLAP